MIRLGENLFSSFTLLATLLSFSTLYAKDGGPKGAKKESDLERTCQGLVLAGAPLPPEQQRWLKPDPFPSIRSEYYHIKTKKFFLDPGKTDRPIFVFQKKTGTPWLVNYDENGSSLGDMRWTIMALGPETARFFFIAMLSENEIMGPGAGLADEAIERFNEGLPDELRIPILYASTGGKPTPDERFLFLFDTENKAPLSEEGFLQLHDFYHWALLYTRPDHLRLKQKQNLAVRSMVKYIEEHHPKTAQKHRRLLRRALRISSISLDSNGNITPLAAGVEQDSQTSLSWEETAKSFLNNGESPIHTAELVLEEANKGKPIQDLDLLLAFERFRQQAPKEWNAGLGKIGGKELEKATRERIHFIQKRVAELQKAASQKEVSKPAEIKSP